MEEWDFIYVINNHSSVVASHTVQCNPNNILPCYHIV